ncbi:MAG: radical SAM/SPASM domain-containing protein [Candidatus Muiribacteriaceae bacterium]
MNLVAPFRTLVIELTNMCGLDCDMCLVKRDGQGFMSVESFVSVIENIRRSGLSFDIMLPFFRGESLLHPQFDEIMDIFSHYNRNRDIATGIALDTNANQFTERYQDTVIQNNFSGITFSLDAFSQATYKNIRRGGDLVRVTSNIHRFLEKISMLDKRPTVIIQFIVMPGNYGEVRDFIIYWKKVFSDFEMPVQVNYDYDRPEPFGRNVIFIRRCMSRPDGLYDDLFRKVVCDIFSVDDRVIRKGDICSGPFTHITVTWDGWVYPCCVDVPDSISPGNVFRSEMSDIIKSQAYRKIRQLHLSGGADKIPECRECPGQEYPHLYRDEVVKLMEDK